MDRAEMGERLASARVGYLATVDGTGRPHVVPCTFALVGHTVYSAVDDLKPKRTTALARLANLRANAEATLLVDHYEDDWSRLWWVRVRGTGRILHDGAERERALDELGAKYPQYRDHRPGAAVIALDVEEWRGWSA